MPSARHQRLLDGAFYDPTERFTCQVFDAIAAVVASSVIPEAVGATVLPEVVGGSLASLGGLAPIEAAAIPATFGADIAGGFGAALPEVLGGAAGGLGIGGDLLSGMGAFEAGGGADAAVGGLTGQGGVLTSGGGIGANTALPAASVGPVGGVGVGSAPALPATVDLAPTVSGDLSSVVSAGPTGTGGGWPNVTAGEMGQGFGGNATTGGGAGGVTGTTGTGGTKGGFLDRALNSITGGAVGKGDLGDLGTVLSGGMMLKNLMGGDKKLPGEANIRSGAAGLEATARGQAALGTQLEGFLQSGKLPPGLEQGLRSATQAAQATIKAQHASRGTSGSSAEAQEIQAASDRALAAGQQVAIQLLQQGANMVGQAANTEGMAAQLYQQILADALERDRELGASIGSFASALARSGGAGSNTITLKAGV